MCMCVHCACAHVEGAAGVEEAARVQAGCERWHAEFRVKEESVR